MNNINIPPSQRGLYKQFLLQRKAEVADSIQKLINEQSDIDHSLSTIDNEEIPNKLFPTDDEIVIYENGYIPRWTYIKKIKFVISLKEKWLSARQITDVIINELEYELWKGKSKKEKDRLYAVVSSTLTNNSKEGKDFVKKQNEIDANIYYIRQK